MPFARRRSRARGEIRDPHGAFQPGFEGQHLFLCAQMDGEPDGWICRVGHGVRRARPDQQAFAGTEPPPTETVQFQFRLLAGSRTRSSQPCT